MKYVLVLFMLIGCNSNSSGPTVTKINDFEYIISYNGLYAPVGAVDLLNKKAVELCKNYTIKNTLGHDKYGDIKGIHIQCTL